MLQIAIYLSALASGQRVEEQPQQPSRPMLFEGVVRSVEREYLACSVLMVLPGEKEVIEVVTEAGKQVTKTKKVVYCFRMYMATRIPLKELRGYLVGESGVDPTKLLRPLDPMEVFRLLREKPRVRFIEENQKAPDTELKEAGVGTLILVLPRDQGSTPR